jgi:predicted Zn-dependent protease
MSSATDPTAMTRPAHRWVIAGAAILAVATGCAQDDGTRFSPMDLVKPSYTDDDLRQLGMNVDQGIQEHVEIIYDPLVSGYINELGQQLVSQIEPQPFIYRFRVIKARSLNAFAIPGGYIYIHSETLSRVSSVDELAGVLSHEIAHVQARHYSRREEQTALPGLAARVLGLGAAIAAQEPGLAIMGEGVNVSLKIGFTREFEAEADQLGAIWMTRSGYDPEGMTHFLDRIVQSSDRFPANLPPYLSTHPFPEDRIHAIKAAAANMHSKNEPDPVLTEALPRVQARLALLMGTGRASVSHEIPASNDPETEAALEESERLAAAGDVDRALFVLGRVDGVELTDPRVPLRVGDLLYQRGRYAEAADSYLRAINLDASRALGFFKLGLAFKGANQRHRAVYAFEQAALRAPDTGVLQQRTEWEIFKLTFASVEEAGFADASDGRGIDASIESSQTEFAAGVSRLAWWARVGSRFVQYTDDFVVRWIEPSGDVAQEDAARDRGGNLIGSMLELDDEEALAAGRWAVELVLENDVVDRRTVMIQPRASDADRPL